MESCLWGSNLLKSQVYMIIYYTHYVRFIICMQNFLIKSEICVKHLIQIVNKKTKIQLIRLLITSRIFNIVNLNFNVSCTIDLIIILKNYDMLLITHA